MYQSVQGVKPKFQLGRKSANVRPGLRSNDPAARAGRVRLTDVLALLYEACATEQGVTSHEVQGFTTTTPELKSSVHTTALLAA
jgi:hypothetical protein